MASPNSHLNSEEVRMIIYLNAFHTKSGKQSQSTYWAGRWSPGSQSNNDEDGNLSNEISSGGRFVRLMIHGGVSSENRICTLLIDCIHFNRSLTGTQGLTNRPHLATYQQSWLRLTRPGNLWFYSQCGVRSRTGLGQLQNYLLEGLAGSYTLSSAIMPSAVSRVS
jgi:hypothetical protein